MLGLYSWEFCFDFDTEDMSKHCCATVACTYAGRVAIVTLHAFWPHFKDINQAIRKTALHECLEVLLSPMGSLAEDRHWNEDEYEKETHIVIRTLEHVLLTDKAVEDFPNAVEAIYEENFYPLKVEK